jgi:hypothetical protein
MGCDSHSDSHHNDIQNDDIQRYGLLRDNFHKIQSA